LGLIVRQGISNAVVTYAGAVLGFALTIFIFPRVLETEQYGLTRLLISVSFMCTQFSTLGTKQSIIKFFPYFRDKEGNENGFLFLFMFINLAGFLVLLGVLAIFDEHILSLYADRSPLFIDYYFLLIPLTFFILFFDILSNYARTLFATVFSSFLNEILLRVTIIISLIIFAVGLVDFKEFLYLFIGGYALKLLLLIGQLISLRRFSLLPKFDFLNPELLKKISTFSAYSFLGGVTTIIVGKIDILMLSAFLSLESTAIYSIAFYVGSVIAIPSRAINKITFPVVSKAFKNADMQEVNIIYKKSSVNQLLVGSLIYIGVSANLQNLFMILPPDYRGGELVVLVIGAAFLFDMATGVNGSILLSSKYYRYNLYFNLILVVTAIAANYFLIPILGILGASIATASSILFYNSIKFFFVWRKLKLQPFTKETVYILILSAVLFGISYAVPTLQNMYVDLIIRSILIALVYSLISYSLELSEDLNRVGKKIFNKLIGKAA